MQAAAGRIQLDVPAGAAPGHGVVGEGQAAGAAHMHKAVVILLVAVLRLDHLTFQFV